MSLVLPRQRYNSVYGQRFALDRASVRTVDVDGHLHVASNPISKANVNPYYGSEIPDAEALGLQPDKVYQLYRDPNELRKAAESFNGKPLLLAHRPQTADQHSRQLTVGSVKNPTWKPPYLMAELDIWDAEAIAGIEAGDRRELSCGYRYVALMVPGEVNGVKYDGRMTQIRGNHVSLVAEGRAGKDVMVGDSMPRSFIRSSKMKLHPDIDKIVADAQRKVARDSAMPKAGINRSMDMANQRSAEEYDNDEGTYPDPQEVAGKVIAYLRDLISPDDLEAVNGLLMGGESDDAHEGRRQATDRGLDRREQARVAADQAARNYRRLCARDAEATDAEFLKLFPDANRLLHR